MPSVLRRVLYGLAQTMHLLSRCDDPLSQDAWQGRPFLRQASLGWANNTCALLPPNPKEDKPGNSLALSADVNMSQDVFTCPPSSSWTDSLAYSDVWHHPAPTLASTQPQHLNSLYENMRISVLGAMHPSRQGVPYRLWFRVFVVLTSSSLVVLDSSPDLII